MFVMLCIRNGIYLQTKSNGHFSFQEVIDYWGACSDKGMSTIPTRGFSSNKCVTKQ